MFVENILILCAVIGYVSAADINDVQWVDVNFLNELLINEFRNVNGSGNNIANPEYGNAFADVVRCVPPAFGDGFNSIGGEFRLNPREISNTIFRQFPESSPEFLSQRDLTQFAWQWGQFIDHDLTLISEDSSTNDLSDDIDIYFPCCDITYDQGCACEANLTMEVFRTAAVSGTGTSPSNPRQIFNDITAFVDGSMVYGSDDERANDLRSFSNGLLRVSLASNGDELLPLNTAGLHNEPTDEADFVIGGDVRVAEQLGLLLMHTIFVRAHNYLARGVIESVRYTNPGLTFEECDELTYQYTKALLTAIIQKITYKDWLPTLFGQVATRRFLGEWTRYEDEINPGMCAIFSSSAFRFGHTQLPQSLARRTSTCSPIPSGVNTNSDILLRDAFFQQEVFETSPQTIDEMINGFSCTLANEIDTRVTDGVRDFLLESAVDDSGARRFGPRDLMSINLQRGRDHGLPDYNAVRGFVGLTPYTSFSNISSDAELNEDIQILYGNDINNIDLFTGLLAEEHLEGGSFGETMSQIVLSQFQRTRDGDRFWYENYFRRGCLRLFIESVTLKDVLEWTTNMDLLTLDGNDNVFQNTRAVSIFEDVMTPAAKQNNEIISSDNELNHVSDKKDPFITEFISNPFQIIIGVSIVLVLACVFGLYIGRKYTQHENMKQYRAVSVDTDTQGSSTDV